jgi:acetylornithine deacetylase
MAELSSTENRVLDALDETALVAGLVDLVRIPSLTGSAAESELQHRQANELARYGFDVDTWLFDLDALRTDPLFPGTEVARAEGYGMVATLPGANAGGGTGTGTPALVLQGHVDVVPTGDIERWEGRQPFGALVVNGILHGRGACDMKAGLAANMAVARTLHASGVTLERPFAVHTVVSEEDGGLGAFATMRRGHRGEAAVITEPTSGRVVTASAGALTFALTVTGRAAHGSMRLEGVNALDAFLPLYRRLRELETDRNTNPDALFAGQPLPYSISVGRVSTGDWASSVPDLLVAEGRMGVQLGEDPAAARAEFETAVRDAGAADPWLRDHPAVVTWPGGQFASGRLRDDHPFIDEVAASVSDLSGGARPIRSAVPYGSDLRLYAGVGGIPSLHYGPGDVRFAHAPREQVELAEVVEVARALLLLAVRRCEAHF